VIFLLSHPEVPACKDCETWIFNRDWTIAYDREGNLIPRPPRSRTPCRLCPKCDDSPEASPRVGRQRELSGRNRKTLDLYYQHRACPGPADDILRRNMGIIEELLSTYDRAVMKIVLTIPRR
jgi:hypothetical protein